jgi:hypothetical protein
MRSERARRGRGGGQVPCHDVTYRLGLRETLKRAWAALVVPKNQAALHGGRRD